MRHIIESMSARSIVEAALIYLGFVVALFILSMILPGRRLQGVPLADGTRLTYKLNGLLSFLVVWLFVGLGTIAGALGWLGSGSAWQRGLLLKPLYDHFWELLLVANIFAFAMTFVLYLVGRRQCPNGILKGLFYGAELNPRWLGVDLKMFSYRPSLIGLHLMMASFAYAQVDIHGQLSTQMLLTQTFVFIYLTNYFQFEYGMLHTWDIIAERFGWMLIWGDYVLVPFFYCIAGWYVMDQIKPMPVYQTIALATLFAVGFWLFRGSNDQKHRYKTNPDTARIWGRKPETIGGRLLVSGFWGIGRHLNYTGEIMVYFSFTLPAGFESFIPYLLPLWLVTLLTHRAWRDDRRCRAKYGDLWALYCKRARFRMVPFIY